MQKERWIIFDLGGVVIDYRHEQVLARLADACGVSLDELQQLLREGDLQERFGRGEISESEFSAVLGSACGRSVTKDLICDCLNAGLLGEFEDMLILIRRVKEIAPVACLSNTNETHWRAARERFCCLELFSRTFASHELGVLKPDRKIFDMVWQVVGGKAGPAPILIDDLKVNVEGARSAGWEAVHYQGHSEELWEDLRRIMT